MNVLNHTKLFVHIQSINGGDGTISLTKVIGFSNEHGISLDRRGDRRQGPLMNSTRDSDQDTCI